MKIPANTGAMEHEDMWYRWMLNVRNKGSPAQKEQLSSFLESCDHDVPAQSQQPELDAQTDEIQASPKRQTRAQSKASSPNNAPTGTTTLAVASPKRMTRAQSKASSPNTPQSPLPHRRAQAHEVQASPKRITRAQSKASTPDNSPQWTPNKKVAAIPSHTQSTPPGKKSRRVGADLEHDDAYQKSYAKWKRIAERAVMPNYCCARTWRGVQCSSQREKNTNTVSNTKVV